jgi:GTP cyclohydrolase II
MSGEQVDPEPTQAVVHQPVVTIPTPSGTLRARVVDVDGRPLLVATSPEIPEVPIVRFHSSCVFGEALRAVDCDCGEQLNASVELISREGGILIYAWEEGRGAGIADKVRAIALEQAQGIPTTEAFAALGLRPDLRTFEAQIAALRRTFNGSRIKLISDNPEKIQALERAGYTIERVKLEIPMTPQRAAYLKQKRKFLGHLHDD